MLSSVRVAFLHDPKKTIPVLGLLLVHEVEFVGNRPPDIAMRRQTGDDVLQVALIGRGIHAIESPMPLIVRVKEDQVGFDAQVAELGDPLFDMLEVGGIESREIPLVWRRPLEGIARRLAPVVCVPLGEHAHADFVEWR